MGFILGARGEEFAGEATAAEAEYNAQLAEREAQAIEQRTAYRQRKEAQEAERRMSTLQAGLGATGAVTTVGSPLLIAAKQASEFELENLMIGYEGQTEVARAKSEAVMQRQKAKVAKKAGKIRAKATLLTGFSQAATLGLLR